MGDTWVNEETAGYRRLFHFTNMKAAKKIAAGRSLKISRFTECNDIFELAQFGINNRGDRSTHQKWIANVNRRIGFICFSEKWQSPLMWGLYADGGKGVCLAFDIKVDKVHKVNYIQQDEASQAFKEYPEPHHPDFRDFCARKFCDWRYEAECRYFCDIPINETKEVMTPQYLEFNDDIRLVGVITGPRRRRLNDLLKSAPHLKHTHSRAAFGDFKVTPQLNKKLWPTP